MRVTINQPLYFQRLHMLNRIGKCDVAVMLHSAQFVRNGDQPKLFMKSANGLQMMKIPTRHGGRLPIKDTKIDYGQKWQRKMINAIEINYRKAPLFKSFFEDIKRIINENSVTIGHLNFLTLQYCVERIGIKTRLICDDELGLKEEHASPSDWMLNICKIVGATEYHCGKVSAERYLDYQKFQDSGIKIVTQDWKCGEYKQPYGEFISNLSYIDMFMNIGCGIEAKGLMV